MAVVGTLRVLLTADTASFDGPLKTSADAAKRTARDVQDSLNGIDMHEARGGMMLLGEEIGIHLPRHVTTFIATLPGIAPALAAAFPILAVIAIGKAIYEATEKLDRHREALEKLRNEAFQLDEGLVKIGESLRISTLRMQDQIAVYEKLPKTNTLAILFQEAADRANTLTASIQKAIDKENELMQKEAQGWLSKLFDAGGPTSDLSAELLKGQTEAKEELQEIRRKILDDTAHGHAEQARLDQAAYNKRLAEYDDFLKKMADKAAQEGKRKHAQNEQLDDTDQNTLASSGGKDVIIKADDEAYQHLIGTINQLRETSLIGLNDVKALAENTHTAVAEANAKSQAEAQKWFDEALRRKNKIMSLSKQADQDAKLEEEAQRALAAYMESQEKSALRNEQFQQRVAALYDKQAQVNREISEQKNKQATELDVITGKITAQEAAARLLKQLNEDQKGALTDITGQLERQKAILDSLAKTTMGGMIGNPAEKAAYEKALLDFEALQIKKLELEKKYGALIGAEQLKQAQHQAQIQQQALNQINSMFQSSIGQWINGSQTFGQAFRAEWQHMAQAAIQNIAMMMIKSIEQHLLHQALAEKDKMIAAKKAFHETYASVSSWPLVGPMLAPVLAAGAFAAVMAFEKGGIVPDDSMAMVHKNEMVLPAPIAQHVMESAGKGGGAAPATPVFGNVHYNPVIQGNADEAKLHAHFTRFMKAEARRRGHRYPG